MEKIGMTRDVGGDFIHPNLKPSHRLNPHVLYRIKRILNQVSRIRCIKSTQKYVFLFCEIRQKLLFQDYKICYLDLRYLLLNKSKLDGKKGVIVLSIMIFPLKFVYQVRKLYPCTDF